MDEHLLPERRIPLRLLAYWEKLRRERLMPAPDDLKPEDIGDVWDSCFLIHVKDVKTTDCRYSYLGPEITKISGENGVFMPHAGMIDGFQTVVKTGKPLIENGEFGLPSNQSVCYRQCLLPLGNGKKVQTIFGMLHMRIY